MNNVINTAEVNSELEGYTTTGEFHSHNGRYVTILVGEPGDSKLKITFEHVHADPVSFTDMMKGRTVVVHSRTGMGYHYSNTITW